MLTHDALLNGIRKAGSLLAGLGGTMWVLYALAYAVAPENALGP